MRNVGTPSTSLFRSAMLTYFGALDIVETISDAIHVTLIAKNPNRLATKRGYSPWPPKLLTIVRAGSGWDGHLVQLARRQGACSDPRASLCERSFRRRARLWRAASSNRRPIPGELRDSAQVLDFELPWSVDEIDAAKTEVLKKKPSLRRLVSGRSPGAALK